MKIGIITPVYNGEKTIIDTIKSAENSATSIANNTKCIHYIFNDGSIDKTFDLIKKNKSDIIRLFSSERKQGQGNSRNILLKYAIEDSCTHIAFLDADDIWDKNHLNNCINLFDKNINIDIIYSKPKFKMNDGSEGFTNIPVPEIFIGKHLEIGNFIWISSVMTKIECFKDTEFDNTLNSLEDYDMWCKLYKKGYKFADTGKQTVIYNVNPNGEASKANPELLKRLKNKYGFKNTKLNLHLACGEDYQSDYINVDLYPTEKAKIDSQFDVSHIPYSDNTIDTIRALHIIEHFDFLEGQKVLKEWYRVLKPGGKLIIETPDLLETCKMFVTSDENTRVTLYGQFFAMPWLPGQVHKFLFTETQLSTELTWTGFKNIKKILPISNYVTPRFISIFLAMEAYK